jgi:hypothetical protein
LIANRLACIGNADANTQSVDVGNPASLSSAKFGIRQVILKKERASDD